MSVEFKEEKVADHYKSKLKNQHSMFAEYCPDELVHVMEHKSRKIDNQKEKKDTHLYDFRKRKDYYCIIYSILKFIHRGTDNIESSGRILIYVGLSNCQMKYYTDVMKEANLITIERVKVKTKFGKKFNGNHNRRFYYLTLKGIRFINLFEKLKKEFFDISDGLNLFGDMVE